MRGHSPERAGFRPIHPLVLVLAGEIISQQRDGSELRLSAGMSYLVGDDSDAHRSYSPRGAKLFIVD